MPSLSELAELREDWIDEFALNQTARKKFREEKKEINQKKKEGDALLEKSCLPKGLSRDFRLRGKIALFIVVMFLVIIVEEVEKLIYSHVSV